MEEIHVALANKILFAKYTSVGTILSFMKSDSGGFLMSVGPVAMVSECKHIQCFQVQGQKQSVKNKICTSLNSESQICRALFAAINLC